ncbi:MAG: helix-turn-helix transcriptional regulator [Rhodobiaceae bacterium]|nr:helix-turn-helix transcriptional regulator [Rhodobiaceae bacterium]MCC0061876.1 helix-turn-helix transcriptional regulator [Rhodobiaceae bacterium]
MADAPPIYLTTKELAELLRIGERKVYDLANNGQVPCVRVIGKLLFPRSDVEAWIESSRSGPLPPTPLPAIMAGSHDPLLEWALRESGSGLAAFMDGSLDGLERLGRRDCIGCGAHIHEPGEQWNTGTVGRTLAGKPIVVVEFARRSRGLIVATGNPSGIVDIASTKGRRFARRQQSAASQQWFEELAGGAGLDMSMMSGPEAPLRTEADVALAVLDGKADAAFGLEAMARQFRLGFVPVAQERYDLVVWRQGYFTRAFQKLLRFLASPAFAAHANEMGGYDLTHAGTVHYNPDGF